MPYYIYKITSPSGKCYIGVSTNVSVRWSSHKKRARNPRTKAHPFYDAIRSYGPDNFTVETLAEIASEEQALLEEIRQIEIHGATDRLRGYNISKGGQYDGAAGAAIFWERVKSDPKMLEEYRKKLSAGCKKRGCINLDALLAWQATQPPRDRWYLAYRASRVARRTPQSPESKSRKNQKEPEAAARMSAAVRAAWESAPESKKRRHAIRSRINAFALWSRRTAAECGELACKISETLKTRYATDTKFSERNAEQLSKARQSIDRSVQAPAASAGLKNFWVELRKDPERYARYIESRKRPKPC